MLHNQIASDAATSKDAPAPLLRVRDASYAMPGYRSFEFVSFEAHAGQVCCVCAGRHEPVRDLLLAVAGFVRPTHGAITFPQAPGRGSRGFRVPPDLVAPGVFSAYCEADGAFTVEEAVRCEHAACSGRRPAWDALEFLARFGLATHADRRVDMLEPDARARFSAALSCAGSAYVSVVDFADPFCCGLTAREAAALLSDLRAVASENGTCFVVGSCDPLLMAESDVPVSLDVASLEAACSANDSEVR